MNTKDFIRLGVPLGETTRRATGFVTCFILAGGDKTRLEEEVKAIIAFSTAFRDNDLRGEQAGVPVRGLSMVSSAPAQCVSSGGWGTGSDFGCELLQLSLQTSHILERP